MRVQIECKGGKTKQCFKADCDLNKIMEKYAKTGRLPDMGMKQPIFGDFAEVADLRRANEVMKQAREIYDKMNDEVKKRFGNLETLLKFLDKDENIRQLLNANAKELKSEKDKRPLINEVNELGKQKENELNEKLNNAVDKK